MKTLSVLVGVLLLAGCVAEESSPPPVVKSPASGSELVIAIIDDGVMRYGDLELTTKDVPEFVKQFHPGSVVIQPMTIVDFDKVVAARNAFLAAGVTNVTIAEK